MESKQENCLAVFSNLGSPFLKAASLQSYYHPSQILVLNPGQQHSILSPSRLQNRTLPVPSKKTETLTPQCLNFLPDSREQMVQTPNLDPTSPFNESWPSTEHSSSSQISKGGNVVPNVELLGTKKLGSRESASGSESVIARYIERFRYGEPTNRQERWVSSGCPPLWWLNPNGNISTKDIPPSTDRGKTEARPSPLSSTPDQSPSGESQDTSNLDLDTVNLQERAARLLYRSESPSSSSKHISTEGMSFTSTITNAETDTTGNAPQHLLRHQRKDSVGGVPDLMARTAHSGSSLKPEDDILFQWRLRRKMEEASKAVCPLQAWNSPFMLPTCAPNMVKGGALKLPEATTWGSNGRPLPASGADVNSTNGEHPCCCTETMSNIPRSLQPIETTHLTTRNGMVETPEPYRVQKVKDPTPHKSPTPVNLVSSSQSRASEMSGASDPHTLPPAQWTAQPVQKSGAQQTIPPVEVPVARYRGSHRSFQSERDKAKPTRDFGESLINPPKSPIQRVLGEVISERLFSSPEPPAPHKDECQRSMKNQGPEEAVLQTVTSPSHPQLLSMAAQLLENAEDSDGTEFEDDPLLQVLRGQREFLHNQLRAVDAQVAELEGDHSDLDPSRG